MEPIEKTVKHFREEAGFVSATVVVFGAEFLEEAACRAWVLRRIHGARAVCPGCGSEVGGLAADRFWGGLRVKCADCGKWFTAATRTILSGTRFTYAQVFLVAVLIGLGWTPVEIAAKVGCDPLTVRYWEQRFSLHG